LLTLFLVENAQEFFKGIHDNTNQSKKWKKQNIGLYNIMKAVRKKSRSWRNSSRIVKGWWTIVIRNDISSF
jgi:hypothetical protein